MQADLSNLILLSLTALCVGLFFYHFQVPRKKDGFALIAVLASFIFVCYLYLVSNHYLPSPLP